MSKFALRCKRMFLSHSPSKVYALLFRHKVANIAAQIEEAQRRGHPVVHAFKFVAEVAFFGDGRSGEDDQFPEELMLGSELTAKLIRSLQFEATTEVELLEVFVEVLLSVHPQAQKSFRSMISILNACTALLER